MNWDKVKEIAVIFIGTATVVLGVGAWLLSIWIDAAVEAAVEAELAKLSFPSDTTIAVHENRITNVESRQEFTEEQIRDLGRVLMRRPEGN